MAKPEPVARKQVVKFTVHGDIKVGLRQADGLVVLKWPAPMDITTTMAPAEACELALGLLKALNGPAPRKAKAK